MYIGASFQARSERATRHFANPRDTWLFARVSSNKVQVLSRETTLDFRIQTIRPTLAEG